MNCKNCNRPIQEANDGQKAARDYKFDLIHETGFVFCLDGSFKPNKAEIGESNVL